MQNIIPYAEEFIIVNGTAFRKDEIVRVSEITNDDRLKFYITLKHLEEPFHVYSICYICSRYVEIDGLDRINFAERRFYQDVHQDVHKVVKESFEELRMNLILFLNGADMHLSISEDAEELYEDIEAIIKKDS